MGSQPSIGQGTPGFPTHPAYLRTPNPAHPRLLPFGVRVLTLKRHQLVPCLYASPKNLAAGCPARQSSVYDDLGAGIAVDGDVSGNESRKCSCTQQDPQGWWEVDLGELVYIHQVKASLELCACSSAVHGLRPKLLVSGMKVVLGEHSIALRRSYDVQDIHVAFVCQEEKTHPLTNRKCLQLPSKYIRSTTRS